MTPMMKLNKQHVGKVQVRHARCLEGKRRGKGPGRAVSSTSLPPLPFVSALVGLECA